MITDDPIRDLEHQLVAAAAHRAAPHPAPAPANRRGPWWLALPAAAALAAVTGTLAVLLGGSASGPSLAQAAYAQLNAKHGIVALSYDTRFLDGGHLSQRVQAEIFYSATRERSVSTGVSPHSGRTLGFLEVVRTPRVLRSYESRANTLTTQSNCRRSGRFPRSTSADPIAKFNALFRRHRIRQRGTITFDGRRVSRLVADDAHQRFVFLVTPKTGQPVAITLRPLALIRPGATFTGTIVRFTSHHHLPLNASSRAQLKMRPHPGAKRIDLGRSFCTHR
jgi:hypothetical protein